MSTYNNFTTSIPLTDFTAKNWEALVRDGVNLEQSQFDKTEIKMLWNAHWVSGPAEQSRIPLRGYKVKDEENLTEFPLWVA